MNILEFFKINKKQCEPKCGEIWAQKDKNPFKDTEVTIVDISGKFVQYEFIKDLTIHDSQISVFIDRYEYIKETDETSKFIDIQKGQDWEIYPNNPFCIYTVTILDIKKNFVKYRAINTDMTWNMPVQKFLKIYTLVEKDESSPRTEFEPTHVHLKTDTEYELLYIANDHETEKEWVKHVIYKNIKNEIWSRPLSDFERKFGKL